MNTGKLTKCSKCSTELFKRDTVHTLGEPLGNKIVSSQILRCPKCFKVTKLRQ